jgi:hypothetical protein
MQTYLRDWYAQILYSRTIPTVYIQREEIDEQNKAEQTKKEDEEDLTE